MFHHRRALRRMQTSSGDHIALHSCSRAKACFGRHDDTAHHLYFVQRHRNPRTLIRVGGRPSRVWMRQSPLRPSPHLQTFGRFRFRLWRNSDEHGRSNPSVQTMNMNRVFNHPVIVHNLGPTILTSHSRDANTTEGGQVRTSDDTSGETKVSFSEQRAHDANDTPPLCTIGRQNQLLSP